ncbi:MAG TPA: ATP-binding protein, partial [Dissulfurispiraceae bacterium]|nr:ATP-binding protein [Dissulfurispiraceae bacterium]
VGMEDYGEYKGWWLATGKKIEPHEWAAARAIRAGESSINEEIEIECFDGKRKIILNSAVPIRNSRQEIMGAVIVNQDITMRKEAEDALREREEQYRSLYAHLQTVREQERTVIAREVHDELGQSLTALKLDLSWLGTKLPPGEGGLIDKKNEILGLTDSIIQMVKRISTELRPGILDDLGLSAAIEWQVRQFQKRTGIEAKVSLHAGEPSADRDVSTALFRILQEALTNVARHAGASSVEVLLAVDKGMLVLSVIDNGRGIRPEEISASDSFGLMGMRERAHMLGGVFSVCGEPGKGTTLTVAVPVERETSQ